MLHYFMFPKNTFFHKFIHFIGTTQLATVTTDHALQLATVTTGHASQLATRHNWPPSQLATVTTGHNHNWPPSQLAAGVF